MANSPQDITNWQKILQAQGIYKGPIDGNEDNPQFVDALAYWQNINKLASSGRIDTASRGLLSTQLSGLGGGSGISEADKAEIIKKLGISVLPYLAIPELANLLNWAQKNGIGEAEWRSRLQATDYWKMTNDTQRNWEALKTTDPAAANREMEQSMAVVRDKLRQLGVSWLGEADIRRLANDRKALGWDQNNDAVFNDVLSGIIAQSPQRNTELVGSMGQLMGELKKNAADQLLSLDDTTAYNYANNIVAGNSTADAYKVMFRTQAKAKNPHLAQLLDDGVLMADIFDQHRQRIAQQLEVDPDSIDFVNDPTWRDVTSYADPKTGQVRGMTETEAEILARKQPAFATTAGANEQAGTITDFLSQAWGVRGRGQ